MRVALRKFPYPAKCALAVSSDIDNAASMESFVAIMDYFNSRSDTHFGKGLGLEVGNSFWFYANSRHEQLTYFEGLTKTPSKFAPIIRELWATGHMDTIHSWGNFDQGGFSRRFAEDGLNELNKYSAKTPVWINHGIELNVQKIGDYPNMHGDDPNHDAYHLDLTIEGGCEFFWIGKNTHIIGQNALPTLSNKMKLALQWIIKRTKYIGNVDPIYDDGNDLLFPINFRDGQRAWEFIRFNNAWGQEHVLDIHELTKQLTPGIISRLIKNQGIMILYTHFNEHVDMSGLSLELVKNLTHLQRKVMEGDIFMATTSRLLKYKEVHDHLSYEILENNDETTIVIKDKIKTRVGEKSLTKKQLQGLTFYTDEPERFKIIMNEQSVSITINPKDETNRKSVSIRWRRLMYPR